MVINLTIWSHVYIWLHIGHCLTTSSRLFNVFNLLNYLILMHVKFFNCECQCLTLCECVCPHYWLGTPTLHTLHTVYIQHSLNTTGLFPPKFLSIFNKGEKFEWKSAQWWHLSASKISQNGKNHNLFLTFLYIWPPTISLTNFLTSWPLKILAVQRMATIVALARDMFVPLPCPYLPRIMSHKVEKPTNLETKMALFERSAGEWVSDVIAF